MTCCIPIFKDFDNEIRRNQMDQHMLQRFLLQRQLEECCFLSFFFSFFGLGAGRGEASVGAWWFGEYVVRSEELSRWLKQYFKQIVAYRQWIFNCLVRLDGWILAHLSRWFKVSYGDQSSSVRRASVCKLFR